MILMDDERTMLRALAIRLGTQASQLADLARELRADPNRSNAYNNLQTSRIAIDTVMKCAKGEYVHEMPARR